MTLTQIALQNLRRRKGKTMFLLLTFALVIATVVSLYSIAEGMKNELQENLTKYGANVIISPRSENLTLSYGGLSLGGVRYEVQTLGQQVLSTIEQNVPPSTMIAPKIIGAADGESDSLLIIGVDFPVELAMKPWWQITGRLPGEQEVVIGSALVAKYGLGIGETLIINGQAFTVSGIMQETGGSEDNGVFTPLESAARLLNIAPSWSLIELNTPYPESTVKILQSLLPQARVAEVAHYVQSARENVERFSAFAWTTSAIVVVIGFLTILLTMAANTRERISEFGILRAIGFRRRHIFSILLSETLILSLSGGLCGLLLGFALSYAVAPLFVADLSSLAITPWPAAGVLPAALLIGLLAILYPAKRAVSVDLADALRYI